MDAQQLAALQPARPPVEAPQDFGAITSQDFFKLIITDLLNQDPLEPTDNDKLLQQIALIRDIEMNNEVTQSMRSLIEQQRFGSAATLLGQYVEGAEADAGARGVVTGVRFNEQGRPILLLDSGRELPMGNLQSVTSLQHLSEVLLGQLVTAEVVEDGERKTVEGVVTGVTSLSGRLMLELDNGQQVSLSQVTGQRSPA